MTAAAAPERATGASILERIALSPVGTRRVEATLARLMSVLAVLFGLRSLPTLAAEWDRTASSLGVSLVVLLYGSIGLAGLAAFARQWTRAVFTAAGVAYLAAVVVWPLAIARPLDPAETPWLAALAGIACGFVTLGARGWPVPTVYAFAVACCIVLVRTSPIGGGLPLPAAAVEVGYGLVVSLGLLAIVLAVRLAAQRIDRAQTASLGRYADAQVDEATEAERMRTDALVHDSVLTTFLSAASAGTPESRLLAAKMARHTMTVLSRAAVVSNTGPRVAMHALADRVRADSAGLGDAFTYTVRNVRDHVLPEHVADAVVSAAVQAMTNSVKHAGGPEVERTVTIEGTDSGGVRVTVADRGAGFDPATVASERLGLRVSILERMRRVGGEVELTTAPGCGTVFVLSWPAASVSAPAPQRGAVVVA